METKIYAIKTTASREEQVIDFIESNVKKKKLQVYSLITSPGMKGYIFIETISEDEAKQAFLGVPYAKGILNKPLDYRDIEPKLEQTKATVNIQEKDIVEIITGPFKKEKAKVKRIDEQKEEVVVELLEAAIPIPITVKIDSIKVIRRDGEEDTEEEDKEKE